MMLRENYIVVPVSHPEEIVDLFSTQQKTLFVIDDICGRYTLNQHYFDRLKLKLEDIKIIIKNQNCKIIASCRLQVFKDVKFQSLCMFTSCECNFKSTNLNLTPEEQSIFAAKYFKKHAEDAMRLLKHYDYFPFLCSLYHKNEIMDFISFCKNPFQFVREEIDNLLLEGEEGKYKYCVLVLCVIHNNHISEDYFTCEIDRNIREMIEGVLEECELNKGTSPKCLNRALQTLVSSFLIKEKHCYRILHDKLFDFVSFYFGQKMVTTLIEYADSAFIRERFLFDTKYMAEDNVELTITIPDDKVDYYIQRLIKDWRNKKVTDVFSNRNFKSLSFTSKVLHYLDNLGKSDLEELVGTVDVNKSHDTPLIRTCSEGHLGLTQWILQHGGHVNKYRSDNVSPLFMASQGSFIHIVRELLQRGADINKSNTNGWSPLHISCWSEHRDVVIELLKNDNLKIDLCDYKGRSPLYLACQKGYLQIVKDLLHHGSNINNCDNDGWSPLYISCWFGHTEVVTELLNNDNIEIDLCDIDGCSSLYLACPEGHLQIVRHLLLHGADINKCNRYCWSPLHSSCWYGHTDIVNELLKGDNVSIDLSDNEGRSSLYLASQKGYVRIIRNLQENGADINKCDKDGWSPLYLACKDGHTDVVSELLNNDVKIDLCDNDGQSSLYIACRGGYLQIVKDLLQRGADINKCDKNGWSPLHISCCFGHTEIVTQLLKYDKIKIDLCDMERRSSLCLACEKGYIKIVRDLLQHGADVNQCVYHGNSPLQIACIFNHKNIVVELLKHDVMIDMYDKDGDTALYSACEGGHIEIIKLLLDQGADANICSNTGESPLSVSCVLGYTDIVKVLLQKGAEVNLCIHSKDVYLEEIHKFKLIHSGMEKTFWTEIKIVGSTKIIGFIDEDDWIIEKTAGASPLHLAYFMGHDEIVNLLENSPNK